MGIGRYMYNLNTELRTSIQNFAISIMTCKLYETKRATMTFRVFAPTQLEDSNVLLQLVDKNKPILFIFSMNMLCMD